MPAWVAGGWDEYARRMPPHLPLRLVEVDPARRGNDADNRRDEATQLLARAPGTALRVALDGSGSAWSTEALARQLDDWQMQGRPVCFFIGGSTGLDRSVLDTADRRWSLGPLTLPHMLVRVVLAEQIYRAWTILSGHPYHK